MKIRKWLVPVLLILLIACQKDPLSRNDNRLEQVSRAPDTLSLQAARSWYQARAAGGFFRQRALALTSGGFDLGALQLDWSRAENILTARGNYWLLPLDGQPAFQMVKQGYRKLAFTRDSSGNIVPRILEIIPDGLTLQLKKKMSVADFTGRIFIFDAAYRLTGGQVFRNGKQIGKILPRSASAPPGTGGASGDADMHARTDEIIQSCYWVDANYVDGDNGPVIYSEEVCNDTIVIVDDGSDFSGGTAMPGGTGSSGSAGVAPAAPPPSNLPNEDDPKINPKAYMTCFGSIPDAGSKTTVTVYVVEPMPGTSFNIGPNSVGHTAIGLTKTNGTTTVTQIVGFYPDATGTSKMHAPSEVLDNGGDLQYSVSISYQVLPGEFDNIVNYVSNPPATYDLLGFNCTNFVYAACQAGNITLPDPYTSLAFDAAKAMTPGALGSSIANLAGETGVNTKGGTTPNSHGACN